LKLKKFNKILDNLSILKNIKNYESAGRIFFLWDPRIIREKKNENN